MTEKRFVTQEQLSKARDEWLKDLDDVKDQLEKETDINKYYIFPSDGEPDDKTREMAFIIFGIVSVGYMSYELFNMIKN